MNLELNAWPIYCELIKWMETKFGASNVILSISLTGKKGTKMKKAKKYILYGVSLGIITSCIFENEIKSNPLIGVWRNEYQSVFKVKDSLLRDSLKTLAIENWSGSDTITRILSFLSDKSNESKINSISNYFFECETRFCNDTIWIEKFIVKFDYDSVESKHIKNGILTDSIKSAYRYDADSIYRKINETEVSTNYQINSKKDSLIGEFRFGGLLDTLSRVKE
jgi:hypothetical protein